MKKISLKSVKEALNRNEMKTIKGGVFGLESIEDAEGGKCLKNGAACPSGQDADCCSKSCGGGENPVCCA